MRFAGSNPQLNEYMRISPRFDEMGNAQGKARAFERNTATEAEGYVASAGLDSMAKVQAAEHQARGIEAQGQAQGAASQAQGMAGMFGGIAKGIGGLNLGGGGSSAPPAIQTGPLAGHTVSPYTPSADVGSMFGGGYDMSYGVN